MEQILVGVLVIIAAASAAYSLWLRRQLARTTQVVRETSAERQRLEDYLEIVGAMIVVLDPAGHIQRLNQKSLETLGTSLDAVIGQDWYATFVPEEARDQIRARFLSLMSGAEGEEGCAEYAIVTAPGRQRHTVWYRRVLRDENGDVTGLLSVGFDDTERKCLEEELATSALRDELTGLYNRRGFSEISEQVLALAKRTHREVHVFFADVDNLKDINDMHGHPAGDAALVTAAQCLRSIFRSADIVARVGGDEFAALTLVRPSEAGDELIRQLQKRIEFACSDSALPYEVSLSLGVAQIDFDHPAPLETALAVADRSMYSAKRNQVPDAI